MVEERKESQQESRMQHERNLNKAELEKCAKERYRQGIIYLEELKSVPLASSDGKTILGIEKEKVLALEKHFREHFNKGAPIQDTYQLIQNDVPTSWWSWILNVATSDTSKSTGKCVVAVGGLGLTYLVLRNLDGNKLKDLGASTLIKTDNWCQFWLSKTPLKNYLATAAVVTAPIAIEAGKKIVTDPESPVYKK